MGIDTAHLHLMLNHAPVIGAPVSLVASLVTGALAAASLVFRRRG